MKTLLVGLVMVGLLSGLVANRDTILDFFSNSAEVVKETQTIVEVQTVDSLADRIKTAQEAEMSQIEASAQEKYNKYVDDELERISNEEKIKYVSEVEESITDPEYWSTAPRLRKLVREVAKEYGVSYTLMSQIISCESQGNPTIQSHHRYTASNVPKGYKVGDREESYGLVQIHVPVHPVTKEQAKDPRFAVDFLAKNIAAGRASMWSCYSKGMIAMR